MAFSKTDREFLKAVVIRVHPPTFDEESLALAQRIAKHQALIQVQVPIEPDAARLALVRLALQRILEADRDQDE